MKPPPFSYHDPRTVADVVALLGRLDNAKLLAGGQSLMPMLNFRFVLPDHVIDLNGVGELAYLREAGGALEIGAMTRQRDIEFSDLVRRRCPLMHEAILQVGHRQTRNRGTLGGSLCQADPSEDLSAVCTTLAASCVIRGPAGTRTVDMHEFHRGPYETAVADGEMLLEIVIPVRPRGGSAYAKVERRAGDWAVTSAGAAVWLAEDGTIADARVGLAAVGPNTTGIPAISAALRGREPSEAVYAEAAALAAENCEPVTDQRGSADYKRHLAGELTRRTLRTSVERIRG
jgi:carbon-monoxide dehydrogenase medium subunit